MQTDGSTEPLPAKLDRISRELASIADYERLASRFLPGDVLTYFNSGSGSELGQSRNRCAFDRLQLYPRVAADLTGGNTRCHLLGQQLSHPLLLAPVAYQGLVHEGGELETARAAEAVDACMVVSTLASFTLEDVAAASGSGKWFQIYWQRRRQDTLTLIRRAEAAGYRALVVTVDVPVQAMRYGMQRSGFQLPVAAAANLADFAEQQPVFLDPGDSRVFQGVMASAPTWSDLQWLRQQTPLPLVLKGVLHPDDALRAREQGYDAVVVSNHGGRALDSLPASIDAVAAIRAAVGSEYTLLLDSGIRSGEDVFKALALGADAVLIGRPQIHALAVAGALGVAHMLRTLREELEVTMSLCGCADLLSVGPQNIFQTGKAESC